MEDVGVQTGLQDLDANVQACVLVHLSPSDLASVAATCQGLAREAESNVVWCTRFLLRFGADFWGEAAGPHPYHSVPEETNEWLKSRVSDVFTLYSRMPNNSAEDEDHTEVGNRGAGLHQFVRRHATSEGYGGWKQAYRRMHEMVAEWTKPTASALLVAGLPAFSRLSAIADVIKDEALVGIDCGRPGRVDADIVSPNGECRVLRMEQHSKTTWGYMEKSIVNVCVVRKPRNWCKTNTDLFRGLSLEERGVMRLVYVVDAEQMQHNETYQELVYRELHGMLGEGKGQFETSLPVLLCLLNITGTEDVNSIVMRLKIPPYTIPHHMCPYYAGPVLFVVTAFPLEDTNTGDVFRDREGVDWTAAACRQSQVASGLAWLTKQPSSRPHWDISAGLLLCALRDDNPRV